VWHSKYEKYTGSKTGGWAMKFSRFGGHSDHPLGVSSNPRQVDHDLRCIYEPTWTTSKIDFGKNRICWPNIAPKKHLDKP
jgi:hypothetical protein